MQNSRAPSGIREAAPYENGGDGGAQDNSWRVATLAASAFAVAMVLNAFAATLLAGLGLVLLVVSIARRPRPFRIVTDLRLTAAVVAVALVGIVIPEPLTGASPAWVAAALPACAILLAVAALPRRPVTRRFLIVASVALTAVALFAGVWLLNASRGAGLDVVLLHKRAAEALARGLNPYSDAVRAPNGAPGMPPGSMIVGYPYPPIDAASYAVSTWIAGDPRWVNLTCWVVLLLCVLYLALRARALSAVPLLLVAAFPGWGRTLQSGWTEPLSAALLGIASATWSHPIASGLALGGGLASKQYFVAVLPVLLLYRDKGWLLRSLVAGAAALATLLPAILWGGADAWRSLVLFHAQTPIRADSGNLAGVLMAIGVRWAPPAWLAILAAFGAAAAAGRRISTPAGFWRVTALALAVLFMLSRQAMPNYWYLVAVTALLGSHPAQSSDAPSPARESRTE
jgi:Glycosyltransferase family 87